MKKFFVLFLPILFLITGCWNYRELNQLAITTAMGIDITEEGEYRVSILIANGKNNQTNNSEGQSQTVVYSGEGKTISRAFKEINLQIPKIPYIGHLGVVVVSEDIAKKGMKDVLDYLLRNPESVKRFFLIIAKDDKAEDVIQILSPLETFPGQSIATNIALSNEHEAIATAITYSKFVENLLTKGKEPSLPSITISGKPKKGSSDKSLENSDIKARNVLGPIAIFKEDKLVGYASKEQSRGINIITNQIDEMIVETKCGDGYIVSNLRNMKATYKISLNQLKPEVTLSVKAEASIQEMSCDKNIKKPSVISKIEKDIIKEVKNKMKKGVAISQKYETDLFGIGNLFYKKFPKYFESINDWNKIYKNIPFKYKVNIDLSTKGSVEESLQEE